MSFIGCWSHSTLYLMADTHRPLRSLSLMMHYLQGLNNAYIPSIVLYKGVDSWFFADRVPGWLSQCMLSECPWGENSAYTPEVPCQSTRLRLRKLDRCTLIKGLDSNLSSWLLGGFHTQFAGSPLFTEATLSCCPMCTSATTTTMHHSAPAACPLLSSIQSWIGSQTTPCGGGGHHGP